MNVRGSALMGMEYDCAVAYCLMDVVPAQDMTVAEWLGKHWFRRGPGTLHLVRCDCTPACEVKS